MVGLESAFNLAHCILSSFLLSPSPHSALEGCIAKMTRKEIEERLRKNREMYVLYLVMESQAGGGGGRGVLDSLIEAPLRAGTRSTRSSGNQ